MIKFHLHRWVTIIVILVFTSGCASFRSQVISETDKSSATNYNSPPVSALFIFRHSKQVDGLDAIPKLANKRQILSGFDEIFSDALQEFSNLKSYATYTEFSSDVNEPKRRALKDSLKTTHDYIVQIRFMRETSFARNFLGSLVSTFSATLIPIPYKQSFRMETRVYDRSESLIAEFSHSAAVNKWVSAPLIVIYPFHTEKRKIEEMYVEFLHDLFRQVESGKLFAGGK